MSTEVKHWIDIGAAIVTAIATYATPLVTFVTALLGAIWYGIRIYDWWKGRQNAYVGNNKLDP